ncbi:Cytochrome P450 monooxygenase [Fulvia fulva]|nr:Cytochrome P450 monooxygenase [Fulvia fulva]WPV27503.1 Cytochrome P450 monooxygenase [Fulvia fulva]
MMDLLTTTTTLGWAVGLGVTTLIVRFVLELHAKRTRMRGLPGPPHSYLFGHILAMPPVLASQPPNAAPQTYFQCVKEYYNLPDVFYFDPWPLGPQIMLIFNADMMHAVSVATSLPKHPVTLDFMKNFGGPGNLVSSEGKEWKRWRSAFNPGFAPAQLMSMLPVVVDECQRFCDIMSTHAKNNDIIRLEQYATNLTVNIIGKIVLDLDLKAWEGRNPLLTAFHSQVRWMQMGVQFQPSELWDIRRPIIQMYNNWKMARYLRGRLVERFASRDSRGKTNHVIDLALEIYLKEVKGTSGDTSDVKELDPEFMQAAISNMKTFVFAGHDTTSSTICYALYYLSQNPDMLARIRQEHDDVFGPDVTKVGDQIRKDPILLNKLDYTLAVTKEVLRIQPPASTVRCAASGSGFKLHNPDTGEDMVADDFMIWPVSKSGPWAKIGSQDSTDIVTCADVGMHRNPKYWPNPCKFDPDRFIQGSAVYDANNKDAWIPFSKGIRNCIGQELAIIETKAILAMTIRTFDFQIAYDEVGKLKGDGSAYPSRTDGILEQFGERAYQIQLGTAKPNEGMPCRLRLRKEVVPQ